MKTDKQVFAVFHAVPQWVYELTGLESPGECSFEPYTVKSLEQHADGIVIPKDDRAELILVEFQFQRDDEIYPRIVIEMAAAQREYGMRAVRGIIFFRYNSDDVATPPWTKVVDSFLIRDVIENIEGREPTHPIVAVFKPLIVTNEATLEAIAPTCLKNPRNSTLPGITKDALSEVFLNWIFQRLTDKTREEIIAMFLDELPDLEETQVGKDLIAIGEQRGLERGKAQGREEGKQEGKQEGKEEGLHQGLLESLLGILNHRFQSIPSGLEAKISALHADDLRDLTHAIWDVSSVAEIEEWLKNRN